MKTYSLCLVLLFAALAKAAVQDRPDNNVNDVHHDFQEDVEANSKIIDLDKEEEELSGIYDDNDEDYYDEDYDEDDDDKDWNWAAGDYNDDEDEEWLDDYEEEDDIIFDEDKDDILYKYHTEDYEGTDDYDFAKEFENVEYQPPQVQIRDHGKPDKEDETVTVAEVSPSSHNNWAAGDYNDDEDEEWLDDYEEEDDIIFDEDKDDILYKYHTEDYEGTDDYDFAKEFENVEYQPPQVQIRDHGKPDKEDETVTVAEVSPSSHNFLVSVFVASGLASLVLFTLAFVIYFCNRQSRYSTSAKQAQLPFAIQHASHSSPFHSSIIKPGKYQPVATQENRSDHSIENENSLLKQQTQLEEKLLPWPVKQCIIKMKHHSISIYTHSNNFLAGFCN